jgi:hypothetical protein
MEELVASDPLKDNMSALTTDGTPALLGNKGGVAARIKKDAEESRNNDILTFHCIVHKENLCAKSFPGFQHVMSVITKVVNFIQSIGLNNWQFQILLCELGAHCGDLVYYSEVWWLSHREMLTCIFSLRKEVQDLMESKEKSLHEFQDPQWKCDFEFLINITGHLNELYYHL